MPSGASHCTSWRGYSLNHMEADFEGWHSRGASGAGARRTNSCMILGYCSAVVACLSVWMLSYSHTASPAASAERPTKRHPAPTTAPATGSRDAEPATLLDQQHSTAVQRRHTRRGALGVASDADRVTDSLSGDAAGGRGAAGPHPSKPTSTVSSLPRSTPRPEGKRKRWSKSGLRSCSPR